MHPDKQASTNENNTQALQGKWQGEANASALWGTVTAKYEGGASICDNQADVKFERTGGSPLCPQTQSLFLYTTMKSEGKLTACSEDANFKGELNSDQSELSLKGTIKVTGVNATLDVKMKKC